MMNKLRRWERESFKGSRAYYQLSLWYAGVEWEILDIWALDGAYLVTVETSMDIGLVRVSGCGVNWHVVREASYPLEYLGVT